MKTINLSTLQGKRMFKNIYNYFFSKEHDLYNKIKKLNYKKVSLYGTGEFGQQLLTIIKSNSQISVDKLFDKAAEFIPYSVDNIVVLSPTELIQLQNGDILVIASYASKDAMLSNAKKILDGKNIEIICCNN